MPTLNNQNSEADSKSTEQSAESQSKTDPSSSDEGQSKETQGTEALSQNLPENLQGKTAAEIAKMYANAEKKLGEQSAEVQRARQLKQDMADVLKAIRSDSKLYKAVERQLRKQQGGDFSDIDKNDRDGEDNEKSSDNDDVRLETQNRVISEFEKEHQILDIPVEERKKLNKKIATEFLELRDPGGSKSFEEVLRETPVDKLGAFLEKSYWLAMKDSFVEKGTSLDYTSISSMSASSGKKDDDNNGLSENEIEVARKLGVSPKDYAKNKNV